MLNGEIHPDSLIFIKLGPDRKLYGFSKYLRDFTVGSTMADRLATIDKTNPGFAVYRFINEY